MITYDKIAGMEALDRDKQIKAIQDALDVYIFDKNHKLNLLEIKACLENALIRFQMTVSDIEPLYANIELARDALDALNPIWNLDMEDHRMISRALKLERAKIDLSHIKVMA